MILIARAFGSYPGKTSYMGREGSGEEEGQATQPVVDQVT